MNSADERAACPACRQPLIVTVVEGASVLSCPEKHGLLIEQRAFSSILEESWTAVPRDRAEDATFSRISDPEDHACPVCARAMERVPYCGMREVPIDRCDACSRIWLDAGTLEVVVLAVARMNYAKERFDKAMADSWVPIPQQEALLPADSPEARILATIMPIGQLFGLLF